MLAAAGSRGLVGGGWDLKPAWRKAHRFFFGTMGNFFRITAV